jgi:hypothetical protein
MGLHSLPPPPLGVCVPKTMHFVCLTDFAKSKGCGTWRLDLLLREEGGGGGGGLGSTGSMAMDQISIKKPNPKCRLFLKIDQ